MSSNIKFFKSRKSLPVDKFFETVLYDKKLGYYNSKQPIGRQGDFITAPNISNLFSEMIAIWIVSTWELYGKPKYFNIVELGPGDGSLARILLNSFKRFPEFNNIKNFFLFEKSSFLRKIQKKNINNKYTKWINNLDSIKKGPTVFFGNEFFDAIPIKQFKRKNNFLMEKYLYLNNQHKIQETFKKANIKDKKTIKFYKTLNNLNFIEFPKKGFQELKKISKKISKLGGCILLIDYGYFKSNNRNTLQSVLKHRKNFIYDNLGEADITSHVNFELLEEFFSKYNLQTKTTIQKDFLENMGIKKRAEILSKKMKFSQKSNLYLRLKRLLSPKLMGNLFKVILACKFEKDSYLGFK